MNLKRLMNQCIRRDLFYFPKRLPSTETLGTVYGGHSVLTSVVDKATGALFVRSRRGY